MSHSLFKLSGLALCSTLVLLAPAEGSAPKFKTIGGPDSFGYSFIDSEQAGGPAMAWEDISATGTIAIGGGVDDQAVSVGMGGISFPYYGNNYTTVNISSNGNVHFGSTNANYSNTTLPTAGGPLAMIAPMWNDLMTGGGNIRYQAFTTGARHFTVSWNGVTDYPAQGANFTFQVQLFESGLASIQYQSLTGNGATGNQCTVGIQNALGSVGLTYESDGNPAANNIYNGLVIQFSLGVAPNPPTGNFHTDLSGGSAQPNNFISDAAIYFRGTPTDPDTGQTVGTQVEILPLAQAFQPVAITGQTANGTQGPSGAVSEANYIFTGTPYGNGSYHWRIRSLDQFAKTSNWVTPPNDTFQIDIVAPAAPTLVSPADVQDVIVPSTKGGNVTLTWVPAADAGPAPIAGYDIVIGRDPLFAQVVTSTSTVAPNYNQYFQTSPFPYYWKVATKDSVGNLGPESVVFQFRVVGVDGIDNGAEDALKGCGFSAPFAAGTAAGLLAIGLLLVVARRR